MNKLWQKRMNLQVINQHTTPILSSHSPVLRVFRLTSKEAMHHEKSELASHGQESNVSKGKKEMKSTKNICFQYVRQRHFGKKPEIQEEQKK